MNFVLFFKSFLFQIKRKMEINNVFSIIFFSRQTNLSEELLTDSFGPRNMQVAALGRSTDVGQFDDHLAYQ